MPEAATQLISGTAKIQTASMLLALWLRFPMRSEPHSINPSHHHQTFRSVFCPCRFCFPSTSYLALGMWTTFTTFLSLHTQRRPIISSFLSSSSLRFPSLWSPVRICCSPSLKLYTLWPSDRVVFRGRPSGCRYDELPSPAFTGL